MVAQLKVLEWLKGTRRDGINEGWAGYRYRGGITNWEGLGKWMILAQGAEVFM